MTLAISQLHRLARLASMAALCLLAAALAAPASFAATERPIVYAIAIDGLDGDDVDAGSAPFISSLIQGRDAHTTYFQESRAVMIAETNPNHTAMVTGAYGNASGVPGNAYALYAPLESEDSCKATGPTDLTKAPTITSGEDPSCLLAQTVFEAVKRQGNPDELTTAGVFGKPKLGRLFAGRNVDPARLDADFLFAPCTSEPDDDSYCREVPTNPVTGFAVDDATVIDQVIGTFAGVGPRKERPDFTFVNLPQVDSAGHAFGTGTGAYATAIGQADDQIERLVGELKRRGEWSRTLMVLLSDHSMDTTLQKTTLQNTFERAGVSEDAFTIVQNGSTDAVYLNDRTSPDRFALLKRLREAAVSSGNVTEALYREPNPADGGTANTLDGVHPGWHAAGPRSADLLIQHRPGGAFSDPSERSNPLQGNHGAPQTRDNFFAVTTGGDFISHGTLTGTQGPGFDDTLTNPGQAENVDVAATAMGALGLFAPRDNRGRFLAEAVDRNRVPGRAAPSFAPRLRVTRGRGRSCNLLSFTVLPAGGEYDMTARTGRTRRTLLRNSARNEARLRLRAGRRYSVRARAQVAGGRHTRFVTKRLAARRCR